MAINKSLNAIFIGCILILLTYILTVYELTLSVRVLAMIV